MEKVIALLKETQEKHERDFIENSLIVRSVHLRGGGRDLPMPDTSYDLDSIAELREAIIVLETAIQQENIDDEQCYDVCSSDNKVITVGGMDKENP